MSKTDKTKPWHVQVAENPTEVHNHRTGPCDLPESPWTEPDAWAVPRIWSRTRCYWDADRNYLYTHRCCGCRMCTGYYERKWDNRKDRYRGRKECRNWED